MEAMTDFIFLGSKITVDGNRSHEIKRHLLLEESYDKTRQHIKKQRHQFPTKVIEVKAMVFPVVIYRCESWSIKGVEEMMLSNCGAKEDS